MSKNPNIALIINFRSHNQVERRTTDIFGSLLRQMIGHNILKGNSKNNQLPENFIVLNSKTITWHSDRGTNNVLGIQYFEGNIIISLTKDQTAPECYNNGVRIRTNDSSYDHYYQYFLKFYRELLQLAYHLNPLQLEMPLQSQEQNNGIQRNKKFNLFQNDNN